METTIAPLSKGVEVEMGGPRLLVNECVEPVRGQGAERTDESGLTQPPIFQGGIAVFEHRNLYILRTPMARFTEVLRYRGALNMGNSMEMLCKTITESFASFANVAHMAPLAVYGIDQIAICASESATDLPNSVGELDGCCRAEVGACIAHRTVAGAGGSRDSR